MKFQLFQEVRLSVPVPNSPVEVGTLGAVIEVFTVPNEAYEVEFVDHDGRTIDICTLLPDQIEATC